MENSPTYILLRWEDAFFDAEQSDEASWRDSYIVETIGVLVDMDDKYLHIAHEILPEGDGYRAVTHIPKSLVQSIQYLKKDEESE